MTRDEIDLLFMRMKYFLCGGKIKSWHDTILRTFRYMGAFTKLDEENVKRFFRSPERGSSSDYQKYYNDIICVRIYKRKYNFFFIAISFIYPIVRRRCDDSYKVLYRRMQEGIRMFLDDIDQCTINS